jgi:hypothetical protein
MRLFRKRPTIVDPANATHDAIESGCPVASTYYVSRMSEGDTNINPYWQQRAQAVLLMHLLSEQTK